MQEGCQPAIDGFTPEVFASKIGERVGFLAVDFEDLRPPRSFVTA